MTLIVFGMSLMMTSAAFGQDSRRPSPEQIDFPWITNPDKLSAATKRALKWPKIGNEWFVEFQTSTGPGTINTSAASLQEGSGITRLPAKKRIRSLVPVSISIHLVADLSRGKDRLPIRGVTDVDEADLAILAVTTT